MNRRACFVLMIAMSSASLAVPAAALEPLREHCSVSVSEKAGQLRLRVSEDECIEDRHCGSNYSSDSMSRLTGVSIGDLAREGERLTATLPAEAGRFTCSGTVHGGERTPVQVEAGQLLERRIVADVDFTGSGTAAVPVTLISCTATNASPAGSSRCQTTRTAARPE